MSQSWWLFAFEIGIISYKKEALQALCIAKNIARNALAFRADEIDESVDRGDKALMKLGIRLRQFNVALCYGPKGLELSDRILSLL